MFLNLKYNGCNTNKLHQELIDLGIVEKMIVTSKVILMDGVQVSETSLKFPSIRETITQLEGEEPVTTYQKRTITKVPIEEGSVETKDVESWDDYTDEVIKPTTGLLERIQSVVDVHDNTPIKPKNLLTHEQMDDLLTNYFK